MRAPSASDLRESIALGGFSLAGPSTGLRLSAVRLRLELDAEFFAQAFREETSAYSGYHELHFTEVAIDGATGYDYEFGYTGTDEDGQPVEVSGRMLFVSLEDDL